MPYKDPEKRKEYRKKNKDNIKEYNKKYYELNKKYRKEYNEKNKDKSRKIDWKKRGLIDSDNDNYDRIHNLWLNQKYCNACDIELTRANKRATTQACMDHDHETGLFRHIICHKCNLHDYWKIYFC